MLNTEAYAGARMRVVRVSIPVLDDLFAQGHDWPHMTITAGLPEGAQFVTVQHDWRLGVVEFAYIHPSFDEVPSGAYVPEQRVTVTKHYDVSPLVPVAEFE